MSTRTGPHDLFKKSRYSADNSLFSFSAARLMTRKWTSRSRTSAAWSSHLEVTHAHGQRGSTQISTFCVMTHPLESAVRTQHGNDRVGDANRRGQIEHLVDAVGVRLRSEHARSDELHGGVALTQRGEKGDGPALAAERGRPTEGVDRGRVEGTLQPRREPRRHPAVGPVRGEGHHGRGRNVRREYLGNRSRRGFGVNRRRQSKREHRGRRRAKHVAGDRGLGNVAHSDDGQRGTPVATKYLFCGRRTNELDAREDGQFARDHVAELVRDVLSGLLV